nr:hypothetical protein [Tanacetum cinerariifolium]
DILKKFGYSNVRSSNTPMDKENPWGKDETGKDVDLHHYRSMIGSLMYLTVNSPSFSGRIVPLFYSMLVPRGEGSGTPTESHHTPTSEASQSSQHELPLPSLLPVPTESLPTVIPSDNPPLKQYTRRTRIAQSLVLIPVVDEPTYPLGDDSSGEACPTDSGFEAYQDRANIAKTFTLPSDSTPRVTSLAADEGIATATVSIPTGSGVASTASPPNLTAALIFTTATESTPYTRRKGKEKMEYDQFIAEFPFERRIELISDLVKYQDNYAKVFKYQTQQRKPLTRKHQREFYTSVLRNRAGWKDKHFKGMALEEIKEKFNPTSEEVPEEVKSSEEVPKEKVKEMMQLITRLGGNSASYQFFVDMLKHLDREDLNQLWRLVNESLSIRPVVSDKEIELWVGLKRLYEPDVEDQLWTHTQNLMHAPLEWKLYDTCRVHHVTSKDKEIFMLVEKDYPLGKGLAIVMICYKLQVENYSQMTNDLILKIYKIANYLSQQDD